MYFSFYHGSHSPSATDTIPPNITDILPRFVSAGPYLVYQPVKIPFNMLLFPFISLMTKLKQGRRTAQW